MNYPQQISPVIPDLIRNPVSRWIPAFAGMTHAKQVSGIKPLIE